MIQPPREMAPKEVSYGELPTLTQMMKKMDMESVLHTGKMATRRAYGIALAGGRAGQRPCRGAGCGREQLDVRGDVPQGPGAGGAVHRVQDRRAEHVQRGGGAERGGKIPFCSTFAKFVTRGYDQIEMAINSGANLKIVGSHAGITLAADGPSQMGLPDVSWFRSWTTMRDHRGNPGCYILQPCDAFAAYALTAAMAEYEGACYMRTLRSDTEFIYSDDQVFNLGGFEVLTEGRDVLLCAAGYMVHEANKALDQLDKAGVSATLVDLYSIPFDADALLDLAQANGGYVVTIEDNYGGGIGSAVADAATNSGDAFTLEQMYVTRIPKSRPDGAGDAPDVRADGPGHRAADDETAAGGLTSFRLLPTAREPTGPAFLAGPFSLGRGRRREREEGGTLAAMPPVSDDAVCIRHWDWSETSQTVSLFTRGHGLVRALAKGSKRPKSPYSGAWSC